MTNEDNNSGAMDFINLIAKQVALFKSASELADFLATTVDDETILEFLCWFFDRLGNKYDKDAVSMASKFSDHFAERYYKKDAEEYESYENDAELFSKLMTPDEETLSEWDETYGSDDSSLWDDID